MRLYGGPNGYDEIVWGDHERGCKSCRQVDLGKSSSFVLACAMGSQLLMEELRKREAPVAHSKAKAVEEWAKKTGAFREFDAKLPKGMKSTERLNVSVPLTASGKPT